MSDASVSESSNCSRKSLEPTNSILTEIPCDNSFLNMADKTHSLHSNDKLTFGRIFSQSNYPTGEDITDKSNEPNQKKATHESPINKLNSYAEEGGFIRGGKPYKQLDPHLDSLSSSLTSCLSSGDEMSSSSRKDSSLEIIVLTDQDEEEESLSSHDDVIQCWQNPSPTQVESDADEDDSSIEFIDNEKIDLAKLAKENKIFSPQISDSIQKFLEAKKIWKRYRTQKS